MKVSGTYILAYQGLMMRCNIPSTVLICMTMNFMEEKTHGLSPMVFVKN